MTNARTLMGQFCMVVALAALALNAAAAHAEAREWNFKTDVRTCSMHGGATKIRTNEDECVWPREVARAALAQNLPKYVDVGSHRYKRSGLRRLKESVRVRYSAQGMWHRISSAQAAPISPAEANAEATRVITNSAREQVDGQAAITAMSPVMCRRVRGGFRCSATWSWQDLPRPEYACLLNETLRERVAVRRIHGQVRGDSMASESLARSSVFNDHMDPASFYEDPSEYNPADFTCGVDW
jgi:hypothetical protein